MKTLKELCNRSSRIYKVRVSKLKPTIDDGIRIHILNSLSYIKDRPRYRTISIKNIKSGIIFNIKDLSNIDPKKRKYRSRYKALYFDTCRYVLVSVLSNVSKYRKRKSGMFR